MMKLYPYNSIARDDRDKFMDKVYDWVDESFLAGEFDRVNQWLKEIVISDCDIDFLLTVLTTTLPAKSKLSFRGEFFNKVKEEIEKRDEMEESLLTGLE